jgi:maltose/moltooligosaccharide transporter
VEKPRQGFWGLWNISFGFLGIQVAFGLQSSNISRVFQTLGAEVDNIPFLMIAGPITGLLVQPIIGHFSDKTWGRFGRRRPFFFGGAILSAMALCGMGNATTLMIAAISLWLLDAALNIAMEPFRAFVGDMVGDAERTRGYAMQTGFIGVGAVLGGLAPALFEWLGVANEAPKGALPATVTYSFYLAAVAILAAVGWTVFRTREYSPEQLKTFSTPTATQRTNEPVKAPFAWAWLLAGSAILAAVWSAGADPKLYILGGVLAAFGMAQLVNNLSLAKGGAIPALSEILTDLTTMPAVMRKLAVTQFFTWIALYIMWSQLNPVITQYVYGTTDPQSELFQTGSNWVSTLSAVYNGVAAVAALFLFPKMAERWGAAYTHMFGLACGAAAYLSLLVIRDEYMLILPMIGIGIAWGSILTMPYVILSAILPQDRLGVYMGIFNLFIVIPQLFVASALGAIMKNLFPGEPVWTMLIAALVMGAASLSMLRVKASPS